MKGKDGSVQMSLTSNLGEPRDRNNRAARPVLGDQVGRSATSRDDYDGTGEALGRRLDRSDSHSVSRVNRRHGLARQIVEELVLPNCSFGFLADVGHRAHAVQRVFSLGGLT